MNVNAIGENAGIAWRALHGKNLSWEEFIENTKLDPLTLACAIGWLARENKIIISHRGGIIYFETFHESYY